MHTFTHIIEVKEAIYLRVGGNRRGSLKNSWKKWKVRKEDENDVILFKLEHILAMWWWHLPIFPELCR